MNESFDSLPPPEKVIVGLDGVWEMCAHDRGVNAVLLVFEVKREEMEEGLRECDQDWEHVEVLVEGWGTVVSKVSGIV